MISHNFVSLHFEFFASNQSEINTPYFRFVSLPKIFPFASFRCRFFRFASKRNEINIFFASFHFTRYRLDKLKDRPYIYLRFFTDCPRISLYPFSLRSFRFFFVFSLRYIFIHFLSIEAKKISLPFRFILLRSENEAVSLLFRIDAKQAIKSLFSHRSEINFASVSL